MYGTEVSCRIRLGCHRLLLRRPGYVVGKEGEVARVKLDPRESFDVRSSVTAAEVLACRDIFGKLKTSPPGLEGSCICRFRPRAEPHPDISTNDQRPKLSSGFCA